MADTVILPKDEDARRLPKARVVLAADVEPRQFKATYPHLNESTWHDSLSEAVTVATAVMKSWWLLDNALDTLLLEQPS